MTPPNFLLHAFVMACTMNSKTTDLILYIRTVLHLGSWLCIFGCSNRDRSTLCLKNNRPLDHVNSAPLEMGKADENG